jgi:hypothetical protein
VSRPPLYYEITRDGAVAIWRGPLDVIDLVHDLVEGRDSGGRRWLDQASHPASPRLAHPHVCWVRRPAS